MTLSLAFVYFACGALVELLESGLRVVEGARERPVAVEPVAWLPIAQTIWRFGDAADELAHWRAIVCPSTARRRKRTEDTKYTRSTHQAKHGARCLIDH